MNSNQLTSITAVLRSAVIFSVLAYALCVCAHIPKASEDENSSAKRFESKPDKACLYIYRLNKSFETRNIPFQIAIDGRILGITSQNTFFRVELESGMHKIVPNSGSTFGGDVFELTVEPGKVYFVEQLTHGWGYSPRASCQLVTEDEGRTAVEKCQLLQNGF